MTSHALHLKARWLGCQRIELEACGSTNDEAARLARAGARHGTLVIAERQTAGRGRDGRVWQSPPGGLYLSAVVRPPLPIALVPPMTLAIGVGLVDALRFVGAPAVLKWPNDVYCHGKKLAGVLVEAQSQGARLESVVIGIGINLTGELAGPVADTGVTLAQAAHTEITSELRAAFVEHLLADLERWIDRYIAGGVEAIIPAWTDRMATGLVARATVAGRSVIGEVIGLDLDGALELRDDDGTVHRVHSGDVEVLRPGVTHVATVDAAAPSIM